MANVTPASFGIKAKQRASTRARILRVGKSLLVKRGFASVTMHDIAIHSGCSRQRLYDYFPNLDAIVFELQIANMKAFLSAFTPTLEDQTLSPTQRLEHALTTLFAYQSAHPESPLFTADFDTYCRERKVDSRLQKQYLAIFNNRDFAPILPQLLQEGINKGEFRKDIDPVQDSVFWSGLSQSMMERLSLLMRNGESHSPEELDGMRKTFCTALFRYLKS